MTLLPPSPIKRNEPSWLFAYYSGCGNLFLIAFDPDNLHTRLTEQEIAFLSGHSQKTVDGILFLGWERGILSMHYFNSDGSKASMCGNGLRCLSHFAFRQISGLPSSFSIRTGAGERMVHILSDHEISTDMGPIKQTREVLIDDKKLYYTETGVPHALLVSDTLPAGAIEEDARFYRFHEAFGEEGANISYAAYSVQDKETIVRLRTYERGVERETGACGTGACAAAVILHHHFSCPFPFSIHFASKEQARVSLCSNRLEIKASCQCMNFLALPNPLV